jgi:hypothetical protein
MPGAVTWTTAFPSSFYRLAVEVSMTAVPDTGRNRRAACGRYPIVIIGVTK